MHGRYHLAVRGRVCEHERSSRGAQNSWGHFKVGRAVAEVL